VAKVSAKDSPRIGGQAIIEGVMMRSPHAWGIAVRRPSGDVATHSEPIERPAEKRKWLAWPVMRGLTTLGQAMSLGFRALRYSANVALDAIPREQQEKKIEISGWVMAVNVFFSVGFFVFMYKFLPLVAATELKRVSPAFGNQIVFNLVDGAIRIALLPVIAGVSYEIIRYAAKHRGSLFALMTAPGLWLQRITTQPPSDDQVECAIRALDEAMQLA
jgi:uncharacterized protein YqhQ